MRRRPQMMPQSLSVPFNGGRRYFVHIPFALRKSPVSSSSVFLKGWVGRVEGRVASCPTALAQPFGKTKYRWRNETCCRDIPCIRAPEVPHLISSRSLAAVRVALFSDVDTNRAMLLRRLRVVRDLPLCSVTGGERSSA